MPAILRMISIEKSAQEFETRVEQEFEKSSTDRQDENARVGRESPTSVRRQFDENPTRVWENPTEFDERPTRGRESSASSTRVPDFERPNIRNPSIRVRGATSIPSLSCFLGFSALICIFLKLA